MLVDYKEKLMNIVLESFKENEIIKATSNKFEINFSFVYQKVFTAIVNKNIFLT